MNARDLDAARYGHDPLGERPQRAPLVPGAARGGALGRAASAQAGAAPGARREPSLTWEALAVPEFDAKQLGHQRDLVLLDTLPILDHEAEAFDFEASARVRRAADAHRRVFHQISKLAEALGHAGTFVTGPWEAIPAADKLKETKAEIDMRTELERALHKDNRAQTVDRLIGSTD
jgi:hypothetical protein